MSRPILPLEPQQALVVTGSENWNPDDRTLGRAAIHPLQVLTADGVRPVHRLDSLGVHGIRDLVAIDDDHVAITTGHDLVVLDLDTGLIEEWDLPEAADLHELAATSHGLVAANTGHDEGLVITLDGLIVRRIGLDGYRHASAQPIAHDRPLGGILPGGPKPIRDDHFHFNQLAVGHDDHLLAVVHHSTGYRPTVHLRQRLTGHGDGAVIDTDAGRVHRLGLRAPHSLRRTPEGGYAILDSGRSELVVYGADWTELHRWSSHGWGRGLALGASVWYAGVSPTRKRYLNPGEASGSAAVIAIDPNSGAQLGRWDVDGVEQVWSVHLIDETTANRLTALDNLDTPLS
ncbi:MAG: hypothetical protein IT195_12195 [Microthrixaceae bacterium]|nr:hypothetical protein [Microthrixaceae bacterium]